MPLYDYACDRCGHIAEEVYRIADKPEEIPCSCGGIKRSVITLGHGGIFRVEPTWLNDSVREVLQDSDAVRSRRERPITDRDDYRKFLERHPNIEAV